MNLSPLGCTARGKKLPDIECPREFNYRTASDNPQIYAESVERDTPCAVRSANPNPGSTERIQEMKTNVVFALLLAVAAAFVTGCQTTPCCCGQKLGPWQSRIAGAYKGAIFNDQDGYDAKTTLMINEGKLSGKYEMDVMGSECTGKLHEFKITGDRKLKCRWEDYTNRVGSLTMTFSSDLSSFKGHWEADDCNGSGAWNGKK